MTTPASDLNRLGAGEVRAFAGSLDLVAQQKKNRALMAVTADLGFSEKGVSFTDELLDSFEAGDFDGDIAPSPISTATQRRREARFKSFSIDRMVGTRERAEKLVDPTNAVTMAMGAALARRRDQNIIGRPGGIGGIFGDSYEVDGDDDFVRVGFPAGQIIAVNENRYYRGLADGGAAPTAPTTLSRQKNAAARILLDQSFYGEMDGMPYMLLEQRDLEAFATSEETINRDYNTANDEVKRFRAEIGKDSMSVYDGMMYVKVANGSLPLVPGQAAQWYLPCFYKSAILYKERPLVQTRVEPRQEYRYRWWAYYEAQHATLRREDVAVTWIAVTRPA